MATFIRNIISILSGGRRIRSEDNYNLDKVNKKNNRFVFFGVLLLFVFGMLFIAWFSFTWVYPPKETQHTVFSLIAIVGLAAFLAGSFIGFLFGIPKLNSQNQSAGIVTPTGGNRGSNPNPILVGDVSRDVVNEDILYNNNTNLEQVSDWLTKILLGAGLVNINEIPALLNRVSDKIFSPLSGTNAGSPFTTMVIIYFTIGGFFFGYLVTVLNLSSFLKASQSLQRSMDKQLKSATDSLIKQGNTGGVVTSRISERLNTPQTKWSSNDPNKGKWGGNSELNGFKLQADVKPLLSDVLFSLTLFVRDLERRDVIEGSMVSFHLHPTFEPETISAPFKNGEATIHLQAWGAFTVGVEISDGTRLELDLSTVSNVPDSFRNR